MMRATRLRTEYLENPLGIDIQQPRLMWNCEGGVKQTAWQIRCAQWDSGKVEGNSMQTVYPHALASRERVQWQLRLWDENGEPGDWSEASFEMGLLFPDDWKARWITGNYTVHINKRYGVDCFRKTFSAPMGDARLYITACGLYEATLNGNRVGDFVLAPGHTDYRKRVQYQTYDVTDLLVPGVNTIEIQLADGWYRGSCGAWGLRNQYGIQTKVIAQLEVDGKPVLLTDGTWDWSNDGPIRFADNQDGEQVDARLTPSYGAKARLAKHPVIPTASNNVVIREQERLLPTVITTPSGKVILDFGQNIAGYLEFTIQAQAGQALFLRFGEILDENGEFTQKNIQCATKKRVTPLQQIQYICKDGTNHYKTKFAIFGFQYVLIETNTSWQPQDFVAVAVYSAMEETLDFDCSHKLINRFVTNTRWSAKNNHADIPTDCPTRERHGWTGDAQIFVGTASYLFHYAPFARKYIGDMEDSQRKNGNIRQISPPGGIDFYMNTMDGSPGWSDAIVLIPHEIWKQYGDLRILHDNYSSMRKFTEYKIKTLGKWFFTHAPTGIDRKYRKYISNYGQSYGEWSEPIDVNAFRIGDFVSPHPEETTAYIVWLLDHMAEIAEALAQTGDAQRYKALSGKVRIGYQKLMETKKYTLDTDRQARLVRPLYMKLLTPQQEDYAKNRLLRALDNYRWRLGTGFLATPFILSVLQEIDLEYAYRLLENEECPGWLYMAKSGATTVWEGWEGHDSRNHYSKGAVCQWIISQMCGIQVAGENRFLIAPNPGGSLTYAQAGYQSIYGKVKSRWERKDGKTTYTVTIPANCTAEIRMSGKAEIVTAGTYTFEEVDL